MDLKPENILFKSGPAILESHQPTNINLNSKTAPVPAKPTKSLTVKLVDFHLS